MLPTTTGLGINGETIPENAPYQKSFQSNTIVPNKSTLVEDDDDEDDRRSDAFALDRVLDGRRDTTTTVGGNAERDKKLADAESQLSTLQGKVDELNSLLKTKDDDISALRESEGSKATV